jgi:hypothetical protein
VRAGAASSVSSSFFAAPRMARRESNGGNGRLRAGRGGARGWRRGGDEGATDVFARDGYRCVYCGGEFPAEALSVDHVQPRVRGGDRSGGNLVTACGGCNTRKGHRRLADFLADEPVAAANFFRWRRGTCGAASARVAEELAAAACQAALTTAALTTAPMRPAADRPFGRAPARGSRA